MSSTAPSTEVWLVATDALGAEVDVSVLDAHERTRAAAFVVPRQRRQFQAAHAATRIILASYLQVAPSRIVTTRAACPECGGPHGRPVLGEHPSLEFSTSRSDDTLMLAVSTLPIGADVEAVPAPEVALDLARRLRTSERDEIRRSHDPASEFARIWTRKEAYLKGIGSGLGRSLAADYVGASGAEPHPAGWTLRDIPIGERTAAAIAVRTDLLTDTVAVHRVPTERPLP